MQDDPRRLVPKLDLINRLILRYYAIYLMRDQLITLGQRLSFFDNSTWGPGRVDTFNAPKALLNFPMEHADPKELMGNADFPRYGINRLAKACTCIGTATTPLSMNAISPPLSEPAPIHPPWTALAPAHG